MTPPAATAMAAAQRRRCTFHSGACRGVLLFIAIASVSSPAWPQRVRASNFSDVNFGVITNLQAESRRSQDLCVYSTGPSASYSVSASGSGSASAFELFDGLHTLPYDVEWSDSAGQSQGTSLTPNVALTGQLSAAANQFCNNGPPATASLTLVLRPTDLASARAGTYSGSLTVVIAAE